MSGALTLAMCQKIETVAAFLRDNPWSTRDEIEAATGYDMRTIARILLKHMAPDQRPRDPGKTRPLVYALPKAPPNPYAVKGVAK